MVKTLGNSNRTGFGHLLRHIDDISVVVLLLATILELFITLFGLQSFLASAAFYFVFILIGLWFMEKTVCFFVAFTKRDNKKDHLFSFAFMNFNHLSIMWSLFFFFAVMAFLNVVISAASSGSSISFSYFKKYLISSFTLLYLCLLISSRLNSRIKISLPIFGFCGIVLVLIAFISGVARTYTGSGQNFLNLNLNNSNTAGLILAVILACLIYGVFVFQSVFLDILCLFLSLAALWLIYLSFSRNVLFGIVVSVVFAIVVIVFKKKKWVLKPLFYVAAISIPFVVLSAYVISDSLVGNVKTAFDIIGKSLNSRHTWVNQLHEYLTSPLIGCYYHYNQFSGLSSAGNVFLDYFINFGPFPFLLFCLLINMQVIFVMPRDLNVTDGQIASLILFFLMFYCCTFETAFFYSVGGFFIPALFFIKLPNFPVYSDAVDESLYVNGSPFTSSQKKDKLSMLIFDDSVDCAGVSSKLLLQGIVPFFVLCTEKESQNCGKGFASVSSHQSIVKMPFLEQRNYFSALSRSIERINGLSAVAVNCPSATLLQKVFPKTTLNSAIFTEREAFQSFAESNSFSAPNKSPRFVIYVSNDVCEHFPEQCKSFGCQVFSLSVAEEISSIANLKNPSREKAK